MDTPEKQNKQPGTNEELELTPWQKEHQLYLAEKGIVEKEEPFLAQEEVKEERASEQKVEEIVASDTETLKEFDEQEKKPTPFFQSFSDYLPNLKAYRDKKLKRRLLFLTLLFLIPLTGAIYTLSPLNRLSKIMVTGNTNVATQEIIETSELETNARLWPQFFKRQAVAKNIEASNPRIQQIHVRLTNWNQFVIEVTEHQEVAFLAKGSQYLPILENGTIINEASANYTNDFLILEAFSDEKMIRQTLEAYKELPVEIQDGISQIKLSPSKKNKELLTVFMNDGNQVLINISSLSSKLKYYPQIAKEMTEKGVVDMEVGIYSYPYANEKETTSSQSEAIE